MQWNEFDYEMQMKILDRIGDLILQEKDEAMQFGLAAAITELEVWSNSPIQEYPHPMGLAYLSKEIPVQPKPISREFLADLKNAGMREEVISTIEKDVDKYEAPAADRHPPKDGWK